MLRVNRSSAVASAPIALTVAAEPPSSGALISASDSDQHLLAAAVADALALLATVSDNGPADVAARLLATADRLLGTLSLPSLFSMSILCSDRRLLVW
jgi:hypothetical protein